MLRNDGLIMTKEIAVRFKRFVPINSVVAFECTEDPTVDPAANPQQREGYQAVKISMFNPATGVEHVSARAVFAIPHRRYLQKVFDGKKGPGRRVFGGTSYRAHALRMNKMSVAEHWANAPTTIVIPDTLDGWWPPNARAACDKLEVLANKVPADMPGDFGGENYAAGLKQRFGDARSYDMSPSSVASSTNLFTSFDLRAPTAVAELTRAPAKTLRRVFWRNTKTREHDNTPEARFSFFVAYFGDLCQGAPFIAHGGSIITVRSRSLRIVAQHDPPHASSITRLLLLLLAFFSFLTARC